MRLRDALEQTIKKKGGVSHAIIREAFLDWDADASGKLDPRELVRDSLSCTSLPRCLCLGARACMRSMRIRFRV